MPSAGSTPRTREGTDMPKSQLERVWLFGGVVLALLMVLIGYTMFISPQNSKTSSANSQVSVAKAANARLESRIVALREQSKNVAKYESDLQAAELALPATSGLPDFLRTLQAIGNATLTTVSSLTVGPPTDVSTVAGRAASAAKSSSSSSSLSSTSSSSSSTPAAAGAVYALPITAQIGGSTSALEQFLTQLQTVQPRAVLISQLTESAPGAATGAGASS